MGGASPQLPRETNVTDADPDSAMFQHWRRTDQKGDLVVYSRSGLVTHNRLVNGGVCDGKVVRRDER
ncbi:unnamed protein product [Clonostachys chloroleuca]|uniref:Uncharacterized protein n=1 Tax=Clonostachys chloroleuca TaxID=1926264 RepID=A0AA35QFZ3_9HYPO|nr:unnamed protein product [Clonostachys chloroleuca]